MLVNGNSGIREKKSEGERVLQVLAPVVLQKPGVGFVSARWCFRLRNCLGTLWDLCVCFSISVSWEETSLLVTSIFFFFKILLSLRYKIKHLPKLENLELMKNRCKSSSKVFGCLWVSLRPVQETKHTNGPRCRVLHAQNVRIASKWGPASSWQTEVGFFPSL